MRPKAEEKGLMLSVQHVGQVPDQIQSDPTRLKQILLNLTGNAVKFTEAGSVTIFVQFES